MKLRLSILCAFCVLSSAAPAGADVLVRGKTVDDGQSGVVERLSGFDVSRDGSGAVVYVKQSGGVDHVYASRLVAGNWSSPERLDAGLGGTSSQPAVAAGEGGLVLVAFVNGGKLVTTTRPSAASAWTTPDPFSTDPVTSGPSLDLSINNKGYLTFATTANGNSDVRVARYRDGSWALTAAPLDVQSSDDAGQDSGRPRVVAPASGVGVVVWGEQSQVYARRVWDTQPSMSVSRVDLPSLDGQPSQRADSPEVASPYDDSTAEVAWRQEFSTSGGGTTSRVLVSALRGSAVDAPILADGTPSEADGANGPRLAADGSGFGLLVSTRQSSHQVFAQLLRRRVPAIRLDSTQSRAPAFPVVALAGSTQALVAWQNDGGATPAQIVGRRGTLIGKGELAGSGFVPEQALSDPLAGPAQADRGLEASADRFGDLLVGFVQGSGTPAAARRVSVSYYDVPPRPFSVTSTDRFGPRALPLLTWDPALDAFGPVSYEVSIDGALPFPATGPQARPRTPLSDGEHRLQVTALDSQGQRTAAPLRAVRVDTRSPRARVSVRGARRVGRSLRITVAASDPPRTAGRRTSGVARIIVSFGDGTRRRTVRRSTLHSYGRAGRFRLLVTVVDRAGNISRYRPVVRIARNP